jgi:RNA recognition motif-containing protein
MRLYVGNLSKEVTEGDLQDAFRAFGEVAHVTIIKDRSKTVSKGFGFVEMPSQDEARNAIAGLHMKDMKGQSLDVNEERSDPGRRRPGGSFSGRSARGNRKGRKSHRSW